jgi:hypothetical protein
MADIYVVEIRAGRGEPALLELRLGVEVAPLSIGTGGAWKISASGVRTVHAYLYFDGEVLFLQSADASSPVTVDGRPMPTEWTPVDAPCTITLAQAQLVFRSASSVDVADEEPTFAEPIPDPLERNPPPPPPPRPFKRGAFANAGDDESTRLQPVDMDERPPAGDNDSTIVEQIHNRRAFARDLPVRPAAGVPWDQSATSPLRPAIVVPSRGGATGFTPTSTNPLVAPNSLEGDPTAFAALQPPAPQPFPGSPFRPPPPPGFGPPLDPTPIPGAPLPVDPAALLNVPPPSLPRPPASEPFARRVKREWAAAPPLRKALLAVFPVAFVAFLWLMFGGQPPAPEGVAAAPSASASSSRTTIVEPPRPVTPAVDPGALPIIPTYPVATDPAASSRAGATPNAAAQGVPTGPDAGQANSDRRERQAADYVATHAYDQAIRIYDQLAIDRPQNPAFHEAARILRQKLDSGTP